MKTFALIAGSLLAVAGAAHAQTPTTTTTTTTMETPVGTTTTTTDVTAPATVPAPVQTPVVVAPAPTARDAITGAPVDTTKTPEKEESLRDRVRDKISEEARGK